MSLFKIKNQKVAKLSSLVILKERDIQRLFESNLVEILGINFLASEFSTNEGGRIDTLGIDKNGSPCIIEYKKGQNNTVIMQGISYLRWILGHKGDFEILCQKMNVGTKIVWDSPRLICVAEGYNNFDLDTVEMLPIKIELLEYGLYEDDILQLNLEKQQRLRISTSQIYKNAKKEKTEEELQKSHTIEEHLKGVDEGIKKLFYEFRERIISMDNDIVEEPKKDYVAYKLATNFVDITVQKKQLKLFLNVPKGKLNDENKLARDMSEIGHWGNGDYEIKAIAESPVEAIFALIKQSYEYNK